MTVAPAPGTVAALIAYAVDAGLIECAADATLVRDSAIAVVASRAGYLRGRADERAAVTAASHSISAALNWRDEASRLTAAERARAYRAAMLDPTPRPRDRVPVLS